VVGPQQNPAVARAIRVMGKRGRLRRIRGKNLNRTMRMRKTMERSGEGKTRTRNHLEINPDVVFAPILKLTMFSKQRLVQWATLQSQAAQSKAASCSPYSVETVKRSSIS